MYVDNQVAQVAVIVSLSLLLLTDVVGNTLIILIILTNKSMKSPMNYLLANLAVADIFVGLFLGPFMIFRPFFTHPDGLTGKLLCNLLTGGNISWVGLVTSSLSLVAISIERYFAIAQPLSAQNRLSTTKVKRIATGAWIFAVIVNIPLFVSKYYNNKIQQCTEEWPESMPWFSSVYSFIWFFFFGIVPIAIMFVLYSKTIYTLWFKRENQIQGTQLAMLKSRKKVTKMMVIVSVVYAVCMFPNLVIYLVNQFARNPEFYSVPWAFSIVLIACNSAINPFIYTLQSGNFRRCLIELVCCRKLRKNRIGIESATTDKGIETSIELNMPPVME